MITSFTCADTEQLFLHQTSVRFAQFERVALRKLYMIHAATTLTDLSVPPGNRLEPLQGNRKGQHSIRINDKWRICFVWTGADASAVEIVDYH